MNDNGIFSADEVNEKFLSVILNKHHNKVSNSKRVR